MAKHIRTRLLPQEGDPSPAAVTISQFWGGSEIETEEQARKFELLRLAFFLVKLRKLEETQAQPLALERDEELAFRGNLLRHVIFQQVITLTNLNARQQALQLIAAYRHG
ncbi:hypothetical protein [Ktedonospora formicarum]|uniref:Uncharacterized protein n=1 Tax=Ktedonospora formicarum TaxID=2778364 RepID=A0A8J3MT36_9CHLR|nr:hypothetical protein [Ktedonospora formicarum]GHO43955.1 hypothetical protein KSX_21180 [Ktedonospora formicarum]